MITKLDGHLGTFWVRRKMKVVRMKMKWMMKMKKNSPTCLNRFSHISNRINVSTKTINLMKSIGGRRRNTKPSTSIAKGWCETFA